MIQHTFGLLFKPRQQWQSIADLPESSQNLLVIYPFVFALLPAIAWYWGTSHVGWTVGSYEQVIKLTDDSAMQVNILFYCVMVASVAAIGYAIHWMSSTYGAENSTIAKGIMIAGLTATPLFIAGLVGFYPLLWVDLLIGVVAVSWAVYLMYLGIPIVMKIPEERGFLFSSAILAIGLVLLVSIMVVSILAWDFGAAPAFIDG
ncbi:Yip1 family protein [Congregibacter variabilis]|uniref:Yip1 family protein n=1 Tax=Congregibacter variabilis TaxID=3081200 RepID=A0ABZ0I4E1_9GAMM|nr:Yip1 family protein [Congregibacter sp. IMCC43200]